MKALWLFTTFIRGYIRSKPLTSVAASSVLTLLSAMMAMEATLSDAFRTGCFGLVGFILIGFIVSAANYKATLLALLLSFCISTPNLRAAEQPPTQEAVPVAVGVVVICVGVVCVYKVVQFCQKHFPKEEKKEDKKLVGSAPDGDEYGAAFNYAAMGSCVHPSDFRAASGTPTQPTTFTLGVRVGVGGTVATRFRADVGETNTQSFSEFQAEVAGHGLAVTGTYQYEPSFERNRVPVPAEQVPLSFDPIRKTITHSTGRPLVKLAVERSTDMEHWTPLLAVEVEEESVIDVVDTTVQGQMFYRVMNRE